MAAKLGFEIVKQAMLKLLMKKGDDGIVLTLPKNEILDLNTRITMDRLIRNNIDPNSLTSPDQVINVLDNINNANKPRVIPGSTDEGRAITEKLFGKKGEVIEFPQPRTFKQEIDAMKKSGDIVDVEDVKISEKITDREMFKNSNLNKKDSVTETVSYIKTLEPMTAMKEANLVIGRKGKYKDLTPEESKKILTDTEDHIFERDIPDEDFALGGRAGFYTGGITDVEPSLDDIGHGSDALMARTRLMSPGAQATTSTGLNYLLAEDNDNMRIPFAEGNTVEDKIKTMHKDFDNYKKGGGKISYKKFAAAYIPENFAEGGRTGFAKGKLVDAARRKFMKAAGATGAGIAALKTGLLGLGEKAAPVAKEVIETVSETAQGVPPYFLNLVSKIKNLGESTLATKDKSNAYKFKDYIMEEDFAGNIEIIKKNNDVAEDVYMSYKVDEVPTKVGKRGSAKVEEYEEFTARPDGEGKMKNIEQGVPDEVVQEGTMFEDNMTEFGKADGGRIGFSKGKLATNAVKFLEKIFGKENMAEMPNRDPGMYQGMLEVVEMFRNRDKEGLKMYMQKFLPHMDDTEIEEFIIGDAVDSAGQAKFGLGDISGQLIRLGSGRDYKAKIDMIKQADNMRELDKLDVKGRKPNASGGLAKMLGE